MIDFAVQKFDAEVDPFFFSDFGDAGQTCYCVITSLFFRSTLSVTGEADESRDIVFRGDVNILEEFVLDPVVVARIIQAGRQGRVPYDNPNAHPVVFDDGPVFCRKHLNRFITDVSGFLDNLYGVPATTETAKADGLINWHNSLFL